MGKTELPPVKVGIIVRCTHETCTADLPPMEVIESMDSLIPNIDLPPELRDVTQSTRESIVRCTVCNEVVHVVVGMFMGDHDVNVQTVIKPPTLMAEIEEASRSKSMQQGAVTLFAILPTLALDAWVLQLIAKSLIGLALPFLACYGMMLLSVLFQYRHRNSANNETTGMLIARIFFSAFIVNGMLLGLGGIGYLLSKLF